jgi:hypothetical protein
MEARVGIELEALADVREATPSGSPLPKSRCRRQRDLYLEKNFE